MTPGGSSPLHENLEPAKEPPSRKQNTRHETHLHYPQRPTAGVYQNSRTSPNWVLVRSEYHGCASEDAWYNPGEIVKGQKGLSSNVQQCKV